MTTHGQPTDPRPWQQRLADGRITPEELLVASLPDLQRVVAERYKSKAYGSIACHSSEEDILNGVFLKLRTKVVKKQEMPKNADEWLKWMDDDCWGVGRDLRLDKFRHGKYHDDNTVLESVVPRPDLSEGDSDKFRLPPQFIHLFASLGIITRREADVLELWLLTPPEQQSRPGRRRKRAIASWKEIANRLGIGVGGAKKHLASAIDKLGPLYGILQHHLLPAQNSPFAQLGLPPLLLSPFLDYFAELTVAYIHCYADMPEGEVQEQESRLSVLRPGLQIAGYQLIRQITKTSGCEFWTVEGQDNQKVGVKIRPFIDVRWLIDIFLGSWSRMEGQQLAGKLEIPFEHVPWRQHIVYPWVITQCELADASVLDVLAESQSLGSKGIDYGDLLVGLMRTLREINFLNKLHLSHRNISPANLVVSGNSFRLCDFGDIAWRDAESSNLVETPYLAPEVLTGRPHHMSDQYSFAVTYYYLRTGSLPFKNMPAARANEEPDLSLVTEAEQVLLAAALHHDPSKRSEITTKLEQMLLTKVGPASKAP